MLNKIKKKHIFGNPNLKFKAVISEYNNNYGNNSIFEVYQLLEDNEVYIASPYKEEAVIDIILIKNYTIIISLQGHSDLINIVKYYVNSKNNDEYLISVDRSNNTIVWNINNNYSKIYNFNKKKTLGSISDFLFCYINLNNILENYIIFSYKSNWHTSKENKIEYTNIYSLDGKKIKIFDKSNEYDTYLMIYWINSKDNNNYIIELSDGKIYINNIIEDTQYGTFSLSIFDYSKYNSGFIYTSKNNKDFLFASNGIGYINILDLESKSFVGKIGLNRSKFKISLSLLYILKWSDKYMIIFDYYNSEIKIIDFSTFKIITKINAKEFGRIIYAKNFIHPIYGESLLTSGVDHKIILWSI